MDQDRIVEEFRENRLGGEPVPADVRLLLPHADELSDRTGFTLHWEADWSPWLDTSYLSAADRANPDIAANVRAIAEVCGHVAFVAAHEDGEYLGYWRGPEGRAVAGSPLVKLDNEGQFELCRGTTLAEALLGQVYGEDEFADLRDWLRSVGVAVRAEAEADLADPEDEPTPDELHADLYRRYRREAGLD